MQIEQMPVGRLVPYVRNARTHSADQIAQIAASIAEFGFTNPILIGLVGGIAFAASGLALPSPIAASKMAVSDHGEATAKRWSTRIQTTKG